MAEGARKESEEARRYAQATREEASALRQQIAEQAKVLKDIEARFEALIRDATRLRSSSG